MGKFVVNRYDPRDDSSDDASMMWADRDAEAGSEEAAGFYPDETLILTGEHGDCLCGCHEKPHGADSLFRMGHDARLRGKLIRAHLTGLEVALRFGGDLTSMPAMAYAESLGWGSYLKDAEAKQGDRIRRQLDRANKQVLARATGPQVGDRHLVKVGRWDYTGQILAIYRNGTDVSKYEVEYVDKKGNVQYATIAADKLGAEL